MEKVEPRQPRSLPRNRFRFFRPITQYQDIGNYYKKKTLAEGAKQGDVSQTSGKT